MKENAGEGMNIQQFEKDVSKVILKRGKDYYEMGAINELEQVAANAWRASVIGTNPYFVYVELEDERITVSQCDCPFDGLCKHEVAAYFAIRQASHTKPEMDFTALFNQFTQQELVALLADIVSKDPLLQKRFTLMKKKEAVTTEMLIGQTKATIAKLFNAYLRAQNELTLDELIEHFQEVVEQAAKRFLKEPIVGLELISLCMEQLNGMEDDMPMWVYEQMEAELDEALLEMLDQITDNAQAIMMSNWLLNRFWHNAKANIAHLFLLEAVIQISAISNAKYHIIETIERYAISRNDKELGQQFHFSLLMEVGVEEEIIQFIQQEQPSTKIRNLLIDYCVDEKRYDEALQLCADGIEHPDTPYYARTRWLKQAYHVHKQMDNLAAQRMIAFELALDCDLETIKDLKALYEEEPELWQDVSKDLVLMIEQKSPDSYKYPLVLDLLEEWERLLYYCQKNPQEILAYCENLQPYYRAEVEQLLAQLVLAQSQRASNRSHYRELANILERLFALGYEEKGRELIHYLRTTYPRKTALQEILDLL